MQANFFHHFPSEWPLSEKVQERSILKYPTVLREKRDKKQGSGFRLRQDR